MVFLPLLRPRIVNSRAAVTPAKPPPTITVSTVDRLNGGRMDYSASSKSRGCQVLLNRWGRKIAFGQST